MNIFALPESNYLTYLQTIARDRTIGRAKFIWAVDRVNRMLLEYALSFIDYESQTVETPTGSEFNGLKIKESICCVSIIRAGESMEGTIRDIFPDIPVGKILIQRDKESLNPVFYYQKLPELISDSKILLLEPMLATGGSLSQAIECLLKKGVKLKNIICINYLASPAGLNNLSNRYPECKFIVASIENGLSSGGYMVPGIGDFGDRYFE